MPTTTPKPTQKAAAKRRPDGGLVSSCPFCGYTGESNVTTIPTTNPKKSLYAGTCSRCGAQGPHGWTPDEARQGWAARLSALRTEEQENSLPFLERPEVRSTRFGDARYWSAKVVSALERAGRLALAAVRNICLRDDGRLRPEIKPTCLNLVVCARNLPGAIMALESAIDTLNEWAGKSQYGKDVRYDIAHGGMRSRAGGYQFSYTLAAAGKPFRPTTKPKAPHTGENPR